MSRFFQEVARVKRERNARVIAAATALQLECTVRDGHHERFVEILDDLYDAAFEFAVDYAMENF